MGDEKTKVLILDRDNEDDPRCIELTPEQLKLLEWLDNEELLWGYRITTDIQFESI